MSPFIYTLLVFILLFNFYAIPNIQQGRQRDSSVSVLRSPLSTLFSGHYKLTQVYSAVCFVAKRKNENNSCSEWESNPQPSRYNHTLVSLHHGMFVN